jgi:hypothetical protein
MLKSCRTARTHVYSRPGRLAISAVATPLRPDEPGGKTTILHKAGVDSEVKDR